MEYLLHLIIIVFLFTMLAQSLSLAAGFSGQTSLAHAGFYGIGAYVSAILSVNYGITFLVTLPLSMLISGILAFLVSRIAIRTVDDYYIIITLGLQVVIYSIMNNWQQLTKGPLGIPNIPSLNLLGIKFESKWSILMLSFFFMILIWNLLRNLFKSPFGRMLRGLSEDEIFSKSLGINVENAKVISFTLSGMLASIPGIIYAHYTSYIDPSSFTISESIFILSIVIIGGMRNLFGIFLATTFLILLPEALRFIGIPSVIAANIRQIIYGLALVLVVFRYAKKNQQLAVTDSENGI